MNPIGVFEAVAAVRRAVEGAGPGRPDRARTRRARKRNRRERA